MDLLNNFSSDELVKLSNEVIDAECGLKGPIQSTYSNLVTSQDCFHNVCQKIRTKIYEILLTDEFSANNATEEQIAEVVAIRNKDLKFAISEKYPISDYSRLDNFDWNIKLSMCNNRLASTDNLLMNLILDTTKNDDIPTETKNISMDSFSNVNSNNTLLAKSNPIESVIQVNTFNDAVTQNAVPKETISIELNREELKYLIASLETADQEIHQLLQDS